MTNILSEFKIDYKTRIERFLWLEKLLDPHKSLVGKLYYKHARQNGLSRTKIRQILESNDIDSDIIKPAFTVRATIHTPMNYSIDPRFIPGLTADTMPPDMYFYPSWTADHPKEYEESLGKEKMELNSKNARGRTTPVVLYATDFTEFPEDEDHVLEPFISEFGPNPMNQEE